MNGDKNELSVKKQEWESSFFKCPVYFLNLVPNQESSIIQELDKIINTLSDKKLYLTTLVRSENTLTIRELEKYGFRYLVPMVTLDRPTTNYSWFRSESNINIARVRESDTDELVKIAKNAFIYGRFSAERELSKGTAENMHATWAKNCCNKSIVDETLVAYSDGKPVGFIGIRYKKEPGEINLIAVNSKYYGRGIGAELVEYGCDLMAENGCKKVIVRTESPNIPAIRMYEKCGFRQINSSIYYGMFIEKE